MKAGDSPHAPSKPYLTGDQTYEAFLSEIRTLQSTDPALVILLLDIPTFLLTHLTDHSNLVSNAKRPETRAANQSNTAGEMKLTGKSQTSKVFKHSLMVRKLYLKIQIGGNPL